MLLRNHFHACSGRALLLCLIAASLSLAPWNARAQDNATTTHSRGRKYKAPPDTSHIEVTVVRSADSKPIMNAAVVFHPVKDGRDEGNLEMKTDPDGKAVIDVIPTGSDLTIQVIADGFATFADSYTVDEASRKILIHLIRPQAQVSSYVDNSGKPAQIKPGIQDPVRPTTKPATPAAGASGGPVAPTPSSAAPQQP